MFFVVVLKKNRKCGDKKGSPDEEHESFTEYKLHASALHND